MSQQQHEHLRLMLLMASIVLALFVGVVVAKADELPQGITCADVVRYAGDLKIPDTKWGRTQARIIAATLGFVLTNAQIDAARKCLHR